MSRRSLLIALFVVNCSSLLFEVVASRRAATYLGATAYANSALLSAFLAGIGAGGWVASLDTCVGRFRIRLSASLLILGGIVTAIFSPAIEWVGRAGPTALPARCLVLAIFVVPVGLAVGLAYPAMTARYTTQGRLGRGVATTYAADTIGAAAGSLLGGLILIPGTGLRISGIVAGLGLSATGIIFGASASRLEPDLMRAVSRDPAPQRDSRFILALFFVTGFTALCLEIAWIRLFTLIIGTSLISFALTVAAFLAALGIGSHIMRRYVDRIADPAATLGRIVILTGALGSTLLLLTPVWERLYFAAHQASASVVILETALFALALATILPPAGLMGAGFSLGATLFSAPAEDSARSVGRLYGINTLGGVAGALAAGLLFIPAIGVRGTLISTTIIYLAAGCLAIHRLSSQRAFARMSLPAMIAIAVVCVVLALPEPGLFYAPYYHGLRLGSYEKFVAMRDQEKLLYRRFSSYGLVTVSEDPSGNRYLRHNGRAESSTIPSDMSTQLLIAHLPLLLHPAPARVLNIGLGGGFTLSAIARHPDTQEIVQAEIDPRVVEAARLHFGDVNSGALNDPRLVLRVGDGRRLLAGEPERFDVIVSEPSHLWVSGVSGLFTTEFYELVASRLNPGGIFATWVPRYEMGAVDVDIVTATLRERFGWLATFQNGPSDMILIASNSPIAEPERLRMAAALPEVRADLTRAMGGYRMNEEMITQFVKGVVSTSVRRPPQVSRMIPLNTDDWPVLEFHTALAAISESGAGTH